MPVLSPENEPCVIRAMGQPGVEPGTSSLSESSGHRTVLPRIKPFPATAGWRKQRDRERSRVASEEDRLSPLSERAPAREFGLSRSDGEATRLLSTINANGVWVRGFEPPIAGSPNRCSDQIEPHPDELYCERWSR